ncbi:hypothetical protein [Actinophytocola sediminis]
MSADEEFGRALGDRLRHEMTDVHADPDVLSEVYKRQSRRRTWTIRASVGAPLVAAAAAAAVVVAGTGTTTQAPKDDTQAAPPVSTTTAQVRNLAQVQQLAIEALRSAEDYVIHEKSLMDSGYDEYWRDRATERFRLDSYTRLPPPQVITEPGDVSAGPRGDGGEPADSEFTLPDKPNPDEAPYGPLRLARSILGDGPMGDVHYTSVDYDLKTWSTNHDTSPPIELEVPDVLNADGLRKAIDDGRMELVGTETIGDRETHHLRLFATKRGYQIDLWVDSETYLPVRQTSTVIDGPPEPVMTSEYDWLPRNEESLAKLELTPPPGFVKN